MTQTASESSLAGDSLNAELEDEDVESESLPGDSRDSEASDSGTLPLDQVFGILKNQRRRYVLKYLYESDDPVSLSEVAEQIAAWENDKDVRQISSSERKRVYVGLYQCHLPKMDAVDVVEFNKPRGIIELGANANALYKYLDTDDEEADPPWHVYSVALSLVGAFVLAVALALRPVTTMPIVDIAVAASILAFSAYSVVNINWLRRNEAEDDERHRA